VKKIIIILVLIAHGSSLEAQINHDSLWTIWNNPAQHDSIRLAVMETLARDRLYKTPDSAFTLATEELQLARQANNAYYIGQALGTQGISWAIRGDLVKALQLFEQSYKAFEKGGLTAEMASSLYNIGNVYAKSGEPEKGLEYMQRSLAVSIETGNNRAASRSYHGIGAQHESKGEYDTAILNYKMSLDLVRSIGDESGEVTILISIAVVHKLRGDYIQAVEYLGNALAKAEATDDEINISSCLNNLGNIYIEQNEPEKALSNYSRALLLSEKTQNKEGILHSLMNLSGCFEALGRWQEALERYEKSLALAEEIGDNKNAAIILTNMGNALANEGNIQEGLDAANRGLVLKKETGYEKGISVSYATIGSIYTRAGRYSDALPYSIEALKLAQGQGNASVIIEAANDLTEIYSRLGNYAEGLKMHKLYILMKDSLSREENQRALLRQEYGYAYTKQALTDSLEFAKIEAIKDLEIENRDAVMAKQRIGLAAIGGVLFLIIALAFAIHSGKKKSDELLLNILPAEVAEELKTKGHSDAQLIDQVTVLFTDFKGFTALSEILTPKALVQDLHECFSQFDHICQNHRVEKIKTIGDAYMAAGGMPVPNSTHAKDVVKAAIEMAEVVENEKAKKIAQGLPFFEVRIGVHTGPVVAGIVGVKKFAYDIWGDTVNTASRMESSGSVGKVNISQTTYELLEEDADFSFESRGKIEAKGKGEIEMYFVILKTETA
jgi:class 3 adenylate cyclase/tetratricopeptide (TPR) repeat protein